MKDEFFRLIEGMAASDITSSANYRCAALLIQKLHRTEIEINGETAPISAFLPISPGELVGSMNISLQAVFTDEELERLVVPFVSIMARLLKMAYQDMSSKDAGHFVASGIRRMTLTYGD